MAVVGVLEAQHPMLEAEEVALADGELHGFDPLVVQAYCSAAVRLSQTGRKPFVNEPML